MCILSHPGPGRNTSEARFTIVARYYPFWAYHSLTVLFLGTHEQLPRLDILIGTPRPKFGSDTKLSHPGLGRNTSQARSTTVARYCPLWAYHSLTCVTHPGSALARYSLNFGVPMEPEASELPKGLVLGRDENIHLRITPLGDVGYVFF
ncbi:unnamed protein product [Malus baccata var. baccata]